MDLIVYLKKESNNTLHGSWIQTHVYKSLMGTQGKNPLTEVMPLVVWVDGHRESGTGLRSG